MKRLLISVCACAIFLANFVIANVAQASPLSAFSLPELPIAEVTEQPLDLIKKLEAEVLPEIEKIFSPEQLEKFRTSVAEGTSFRKAFKSLTLTPEQKTQLGSLLKSLPKKDAFASLTPDQKKQLFLKKKEMFKPTPEEIGEKISAGMKLAQEKGGSFAVGKEKSAFIPSPADIVAKITEKMKMAQGKAQD